jgi:hypothetical protein
MLSHKQLVFEKFARRCPVCNGCVYRDFTFLEKVCLFLPFHLAFKARHHCDSCGSKFSSVRNLTDFIFVGFFGLATYLLKEDWIASLVVLAIWLFVSLARPRKSVGPFDTFIAAMILNTLWFFVFVLRSHAPPMFINKYGHFLFGLGGLLGFFFGYAMLYLD